MASKPGQAGSQQSQLNMTEREIRIAAGLLVKKHGSRALILAAQKADQFLAGDNMDGCALWMRITRAAGALIELPDGRLTKH